MTVLCRTGDQRDFADSDDEGGISPATAKLMAMIDPNDPAWARIVAVLSEMRAAGVDLDEAAVKIALKIGRWRWVEDEKAVKRLVSVPCTTVDAEGTRRSIVYYVRRGNLIKIGTTASPHQRFGTLLPDEILAFEPGGPREETLRHRQFSHLRKGARGEYFEPGDELLAHVAAVRAEHGCPEPTWPTTAAIGRQEVVMTLPPPTSLELVIASEGAARCGLSVAMVKMWASRRRMPKVGVDGRGRGLYYLEHIRRLGGQDDTAYACDTPEVDRST